MGINFSASSQKHHYNQIGNAMYRQLSEELDVPFEQKGQVMLCCDKWERLPCGFCAKTAGVLASPASGT